MARHDPPNVYVEWRRSRPVEPPFRRLLNEAKETTMTSLTMWDTEKSPLILRRVGKTGEEAAELLKVTNRIVLQGLDGVDPSTGKTNRQALTEEIADVMAQCDVCIDSLDLDWDAIRRRVRVKVELMREWEAMYAPQAT